METIYDCAAASTLRVADKRAAVHRSRVERVPGEHPAHRGNALPSLTRPPAPEAVPDRHRSFRDRMYRSIRLRFVFDEPELPGLRSDRITHALRSANRLDDSSLTAEPAD
jgi:hypothetical protein